MQTNVSAVGTMVKIVDVRDFVEKTAYRPFPAGTLTAEFHYRGEMGSRDDRVRIRFADGCGRIAKDGTAADVTVTCGQGDLASLLMGSCELAGMIRLGAVSVNGEARA